MKPFILKPLDCELDAIRGGVDFYIEINFRKRSAALCLVHNEKAVQA